MRDWVNFLQIKRDERGWGERAAIAWGMLLMPHRAAHHSRTAGVYWIPNRWGRRSWMPVPTDEQVYRDRWL